MEVLSVESGHEVVQSNVPKTLWGQILHLNVGQKMDRAEDTKAEELHLVKLVKQLVKQCKACNEWKLQAQPEVVIRQVLLRRYITERNKDCEQIGVWIKRI
jgi:hypothetical protein